MPTPAPTNKWEQMRGDESEFSEVGTTGHVVRTEDELHTHAARLAKLISSMQQTGPGDANLRGPALWKHRQEGYFYVLPPDYLYIGLGDVSLRISEGPDGMHYPSGLKVPRWASQDYIGVHWVGLHSIEDARDARIAFHTTQPDTRETSAMVLTGDPRLLEHIHFRDSRQFMPEGLNLMSPDSLIPLPAAEARPYDLVG